MIIRQATSADSTGIKSLLAQLGYPGLTEDEVKAKIKTYTSGSYNLLVTEVDGEVIAFISLHVFEIFHSKGLIGRISAFCVDENFRSKGIGAKLLQAAEDFFIKSGCSKIEVTSNAKRTRTHQFYLNLAYEEDSRRFVKYVK
jgi:GNAT superfamily N-acetyltransferase